MGIKLSKYMEKILVLPI